MSDDKDEFLFAKRLDKYIHDHPKIAAALMTGVWTGLWLGGEELARNMVPGNEKKTKDEVDKLKKLNYKLSEEISTYRDKLKKANKTKKMLRSKRKR